MTNNDSQFADYDAAMETALMRVLEDHNFGPGWCEECKALWYSSAKDATAAHAARALAPIVAEAEQYGRERATRPTPPGAPS